MRIELKGYSGVLEHFGGVAALARALGVTPQAVYQWKGRVPADKAIQIETLSGGNLRAVELYANHDDSPEGEVA